MTTQTALRQKQYFQTMVEQTLENYTIEITPLYDQQYNLWDGDSKTVSCLKLVYERPATPLILTHNC